MNEELERRLSECAKTVLKCDDELAQAKDNLKKSPTDANVIALTMARERLDGAREALAEAEAGKARLDAVKKSTEYKAETKRLDEIKRDADKRVNELPEKVMQLLEYIDGIDTLAHEYNRIVTKRGGVPFASAWKYARCWHIQSQLQQWIKNWQATEVSTLPVEKPKRSALQKAVDNVRYRDPDVNPTRIQLTRNASEPNNPDDTNWRG